MRQPFESIAGSDCANVIFICDHASNAVPVHYRGLGLPSAQFARHIAYDIGAAEITRELAREFGAPAVLSHFSRLVIDANRGIDDPTLVMRLSDGAVIPGNAAVDQAEIERRIQLFWRPYRDAIQAEIAGKLARGIVPAIVSIHSFTPVWKGIARPWDIAILWDNDHRLAQPLIAALSADGFTVGDNEPYDGALVGDTLYELATKAGLPHVLIEARQDLVADPLAAATFAARLACALRPVLARADTHMIRNFGSRAEGQRRTQRS